MSSPPVFISEGRNGKEEKPPLGDMADPEVGLFHEMISFLWLLMGRMVTGTIKLR